MKQTLIRAAHRLTRHIGPRWRYPNRVRRVVCPRLDGLARRRYGRPLIRDKSDAHAEVVASAEDHATAARALWRAGYRRNVLATCKYVDGAAGRRWERSSWALHDGDVQYHAYLFAGERRTAVYHHRETSYLADASGHEGHADDGRYAPGDPDGTVRAALAGVDGVTYSGGASG